jgi:hypothetical protein
LDKGFGQADSFELMSAKVYEGHGFAAEIREALIHRIGLAVKL